MPVVNKKLMHIFTDEEKQIICDTNDYGSELLSKFLICHPNSPYYDKKDPYLLYLFDKIYPASITKWTGKSWCSSSSELLDTLGYLTSHFINQLFYNAVKACLQEMTGGPEITFDDENFAFSVFGSKFYIFMYMHPQNRLAPCTPLIFQHGDHCMQFNSFDYVAMPEPTVSNEVNGKKYLVFNKNPNYNYCKILNNDKDNINNNWIALQSIQADFKLMYNENYLYMRYKDINNIWINYFMICECEAANNKKLIYTSRIPLGTQNATISMNGSYSSQATGDYSDRIRSRDSMCRINIDVSNKLDQNESYTYYDLTDPDDVFKPLLPISYKHRELFQDKNLIYTRNCMHRQAWVDMDIPLESGSYFYKNPGIFGYQPDERVCLLKQITMFWGTLKFPHLYWCDETFQADHYYEINGKQYYCVEQFVLYEL